MTSKKMLIMVMFITLCLASTSSTPTTMRSLNRKRFEAENICNVLIKDEEVVVYFSFQIGKRKRAGIMIEKLGGSDRFYLESPEVSVYNW